MVEDAPVFGDLTQAALDRAYDQAHWAPNAGDIQARLFAASADVARRMPPQTRRYGPGEHQLIDIFTPPDAAFAAASGAPVFVLIHGGAWRMAMREAFYGPAPTILAARCILAVVGFDCLPAISMVEMAGQVRDAVAWIGAHADTFGGDGGDLNLVGHSSGAHLAAVVLATDWTSLGLKRPGIQSAMLVSGLYDLEPVMLSSRRQYIALTEEQATALSPIRHVDRITASVSVVWGGDESPEFKRQSAAFAAALDQAGRLHEGRMVAGRNHFEMLEALSDADGPLVRMLARDTA